MEPPANSGEREKGLGREDGEDREEDLFVEWFVVSDRQPRGQKGQPFHNVDCANLVRQRLQRGRVGGHLPVLGTRPGQDGCATMKYRFQVNKGQRSRQTGASKCP